MKHRHLRRTALALVLAATLVACGGGGGSPGTTGPGAGGLPSGEASVTLELVDRSGSKIQKLSGTTVGVARAKVFDTGGAPAVNARVVFSVGNLLVMAPADGVATTNSSGVASIDVSIVDERAQGEAKIAVSAPALGGGVVDEIAIQVDGTIVK